MIGYQDLLIGAVIVIFLFGAKRLPELAASLGKSMKEFRKATAEPDHPESAPPAPAAATARTCASCRTPLEADWTHCPRCGSPATPAPTSTPRP